MEKEEFYRGTIGTVVESTCPIVVAAAVSPWKLRRTGWPG